MSGRIRVVLIVSGALLVLVACESPLDPLPFAPQPCTVSPTAALVATDSTSTSDIASALSDAATRLTLSLPQADRAEMRAALAQLGDRTAGDDSDIACRALLVARDVLERQPDSPATLPDRRAMWLVIELAATRIRQ
jgi:hypothetical protein